MVILGLWDQTGAFADVGPLNDRGMRMALEERGMKILGKPIKYVTRDGATQRGGDMVLGEEVGKAARTVAARKGNGHAGNLTGRRDGAAGGKEECPRLPEATPDIA